MPKRGAMVFSTQRWAVRSAGLLLACFLAMAGCVTPAPGTLGYAYFVDPAANDPWTGKISRWQQRERADIVGALPAPGATAPAAVAEPGEGGEALPGVSASLHAKYTEFRASQKRTQARQVAEWIQSQAQDHYVPDGPIDSWATFAETLRENGDDCDGLELLTFYMLRELGFTAESVFRGIVYRRRDGQHHMVTLWFEDPDDPWVIDPTGAMTTGMPRMSDVPEWVPLKVFSVEEHFNVERSRAVASR